MFIDEVIVDFQAFKRSKHEFVIKELAFLKKDGMCPTSYQFRPPCLLEDLPEKYQAQCRWLTQHYRGLSWNSGVLPYDHL